MIEIPPLPEQNRWANCFTVSRPFPQENRKESGMQYRQFGSLDWYASALGFGCMRLPTLGDRSAIDEPEAARMLAYAIDHGVNYLDTAYGYHGGNSERFLGRFLSSGYRDRVRVATKLPCPLVEKEEDFERLLGEQMARLQSEHIDFYLLHGLRQDRWENMLRLDVPAKMEKAVADGRVGHLGFSFHGNTTLLKQVIDTLLSGHGLDYDGIARWVIHPGGQKVITAFQRALRLPDESLAPSRTILLNYGNMSSASVIFVLEETLRNHPPQPGDRVLVCSFGAGFSAFAGLLEQP